MPGRPEFSQPGTQGGGQTVATQNRPNIITLDETQTDTVSVGGSEVVEVYAPTGSVYNVKAIAMRCQPPDGAADGDHRMYISTSGGQRVLWGNSKFDNQIRYQYSVWLDANKSQYPNTEAAQALAEKGLKATEIKPIQFNYSNNTDVDQTNERVYNLLIEQVTY